MHILDGVKAYLEIDLYPRGSAAVHTAESYVPYSVSEKVCVRNTPICSRVTGSSGQ
jgi:hypothetical protein